MTAEASPAYVAATAQPSTAHRAVTTSDLPAYVGAEEARQAD